MTIETSFLESIHYFLDLSPGDINSIKELIFVKAFETGKMILLEGESAESLYFVKSGAVKIYKTSTDGKEQIINIVQPGESFNDAAAFDDLPNLTNAQAIGPTILYGVSKSDLRVIVQNHPRVASNVIKVLVNQVRHLVSLVEDLSFKRVIDRIAKILLKYAGDGATPKPRLTQQEMASMAGTVREVVGRSLKALEARKLIRIEHHRIVVTDEEALKDMAEVPS